MKIQRTILLLLLFPSVAFGLPSPKKTYNRLSHYNWSGPYIGFDAGFGANSGGTRFTPLPDATSFAILAPTTVYANATDGFTLGGHMGFNSQMGDFIWGLEGDMQKGPDSGVTKTSFTQNNGEPYGGTLQTGEITNWLATFRLRTGITPLYRLMVYLTSGAAYGSVDYSADTDTRPGGGNRDYPAAFEKTKLGWIFGGGVEWVTDWHWSVRTEFLHYDLGDESATASAVPANPPFQVGYHWQTQSNLVRLGINYKF
jgi:outer membrane immunogenic protein